MASTLFGLFVVDADPGVQFGQFRGRALIHEHHSAEGEEGPNDHDAHLDRVRAVEDIGSHEGAVFGEGEGKIPASPMARS